jgi:hypothetical protein
MNLIIFELTQIATQAGITMKDPVAERLDADLPVLGIEIDVDGDTFQRQDVTKLNLIHLHS